MKRWALAVAAVLVAGGCTQDSTAATGDERPAAETPLQESSADGLMVRRIVPSDADRDFGLGGPSPDGDELTFVDWSVGNLMVRNLEDGKDRRLTRKLSWLLSQEFALFSTFTADGRSVAYTWFNKSAEPELRLIGAEGGSPRTLLHDPAVVLIVPAGSTPDGSRILATLSHSDGSHEIAFVPVDGGARQVVRRLDWRAPSKVLPSPDGRWVAYDLAGAPGATQRDIFVVSTAGGEEAAVLATSEDERLFGWSADGGALLYVVPRGGSDEVWRLPVREGRRSGDPELLRSGLWHVNPLATSGSRAFYTVTLDSPRLYSLGIDLTAGSAITPPHPLSHGVEAVLTGGDWSPDGRYVAYVLDGYPLRLVLRETDTGDVRELPMRLEQPSRVRWAPDGKSLVLTGRRDGRAGAYRIDLASGDATLLVADSTEGRVRFPALSPNGATLYYYREHRDPERTGVYAHDLPSGVARRILAGVVDFALSPDGTRIAATLPEGEELQRRLVVLPSDGGEARTFALGRLIFGNLAWLPDGSGLLYTTSPVDPSEAGQSLWHLSLAGGAPRKIHEGLDAKVLRVHPDGHRISYIAGTSRKEVWVMEGVGR